MRQYRPWDERYQTADTPWECGIPNAAMQRLFNEYIDKNTAVLEIGCGIGTNAKWLAEAGYAVTAIDLSSYAIRQAIQNNEDKNNPTFLSMDFMHPDVMLPSFPVIFDCAVLQVFHEPHAKKAYVEKIAKQCSNQGYWINISSSKDGAEEITAKTGVKAPPSLSAQEIIECVEPFFEVIEMRRCGFTLDRKSEGKAVFNAWGSLFKKR